MLKDLLALRGISTESEELEQPYDIEAVHDAITADVVDTETAEGVVSTLESLVVVLESHSALSDREIKYIRYAAEAEVSCHLFGKAKSLALESDEPADREEVKSGIGDKIKAIAKTVVDFIRSIYAKIRGFIASLVDGCKRRIARARDMIQKLRAKGDKDPQNDQVAKEDAGVPVHSYTLVIGDKPHEYEHMLKAANDTANHVLDVKKYEAAVKSYVEHDQLGEHALPLISPMQARYLPGRPTIDYDEDNKTLKFRLTEDMFDHAAVGVPMMDTRTLIRLTDLIQDISSRVGEFGDSWRQFDHYVEHQLVEMLHRVANAAKGESIDVKYRKVRNLFTSFAQAPRSFGLYVLRLADASYDYVKYCYSRY